MRNRSGYHAPSYDRAIGAWVPVEYQNVAPDGATYVLYHDATTDVPNALYLVDAKTGKRRLILPTPVPPPGSEWRVVDYASEGIYLWTGDGGMAKEVPGLWLLDPQTGRVRLVDGSHVWAKVAGGAAWALEPHVHGASSYKVYRLDLTSGQVRAWYTSNTEIQNFSPTPDGGLLINYGNVGSARLGLLAGPGLFSPIELPPGLTFPWDMQLVHPGVWVGLVGGIALYTKTEGVRIMARNPDVSGVYSAAGGCW